MIQAPRVIRIEGTWGLKVKILTTQPCDMLSKKIVTIYKLETEEKAYNNCSHKQKMDRQISAESPFTSAKGLKPLLPVRIIKNI